MSHRTRTRGYSMHHLPTGTITLLFTDIEGSTQLLRRLGDQYVSVLEESRRLQRAVFQRWNGYEVDTQGDAFFVAFARATDAATPRQLRAGDRCRSPGGGSSRCLPASLDGSDE